MNSTPDQNLPPVPDYKPLTTVAHPVSGQVSTQTSPPQRGVQPPLSTKAKLKKILIGFTIATVITMAVTGIIIAILIVQFTAQFDGLEEDMRRDVETLQL